SRGVRFVDPGEGFLACGWIGKGRLAEPESIVDAAEAMLRPAGSLLGRRLVISAGPTFEDLDPVRFIGNRSSGRMGYAIAAESGDPRTRAGQKRSGKQVDLIVANDISRAGAGFDVETNAAVLISADGEVDTPLQLKTELASTIVDRIEQMLTTRASAAKQS